MKGFTFDLQRFATTWLLTQDDGTLTLTDESDSTNSKTWTSTHTANSEKFSFKDVIPVGDTVKLAEDITLAKVQFVLYKDVTLDLNGKTLKATGDSPTNLIIVSRSTACNFTITDTSDDGNGALVKETSGTSITSVVDASGATAIITLERGNVINSSSEKSCGIKIYDASSSFTMTGGSIKTLSEGVDTRALDATGGSTCTINISGGTIESGNDGLRIKSKVTVNISGGNFSTNNLVNQTSTGNTFNITGGVFNQANETLGINTEATIDGETKYCVSLDSLGDGYITATIDNVTQYFSSDETLAAAVSGKTPVTIDGVTQYFSSDETLAAAVSGKTPVTIDGQTKYFTNADDATSAKDDCVAKIGDNYYTTLAKAANFVDGKTATINLLKDETGAGIKFSNAATNVKINFGEHTYTVGNPAVGSAGTESQAFHFDKGAIVTLENGTITSSAESSSVAMLVQNYSNLTLDNMTLDGSNLADAYYGGVKPENLGACVTLSINNGTVNIKGDTSIIARQDTDRSHYAMDVCASNSYPDGAHVTVDTTGKIGNVLVDGSAKGSDGKFVGDLTINGGTVGEIRVDSDAVNVNAQDKISIKGGTLANGNLVKAKSYLVLQSDPLFEVFADGYVLAVEGWNSTSDGFFYVNAPESGNLGTKAITVSGIDSTDQIKFDAQQKVFVVPTTATATVNDGNYKLVKVSYDGSTANVKTTADAIEITEKLLADTVTKISASGNANTVYISGGEKVNEIVGGAKNDTLGGSNADITLTGGQGADIFIYDSGELTITDYGTGSDKISVGADAGNPNVSVSGNDLVLTFGDGKTVNLLDAADKVVTLTNGEDNFYYSKEGQTSDDGLSVTLPASTTKYTVKAPLKNVDGSNTSGVTITGNSLDNILTGSSGNDKLLGDKGNDTLRGGTGGKDTLTGGNGNDVFVYAAGNAVITDYSVSGTNGADKISLDATPTSFKFNKTNLVLTFDGKNTLTVNGAKNKALTFVDGDDSIVRTYIDNGAVREGATVTLDQNFKGSGYNISKVNAITQIDASTATRNLNLVGNNLDNTLTGGTKNDTLAGGKGNDLLTGGKGSDTLIYNGGADIVTDYATQDTLKLKGQTVKSASFGEEDVVFTFGGNGNTLTLQDAVNKTITVRDNSNKVWTYNDEYTAQGDGVTLQASTTKFDASKTTYVTIDGSQTEGVTLTGNSKNNVFVGSKGADTFIYESGNDTIKNYDAADKVQVEDIGDVTAAKFNSSKTIVTVGKGSLIFNNAQTSINLVDEDKKTATLTKDGVITDNAIQLFNGTKTYSGDASTIDASNVKNVVTLAGGSKAQTFTGAAGKTVYTYSGAGTMTIANYAAGDKISVKGSVTNFAVDGDDITLTITNGDSVGSIVLKGAASKLITLHDSNDKSGKYTARVYPQEGVTADKAIPTAVTLASSVENYSAPSTVKQITYTGGEVTITDFDTTKGKINHGTLAITDVSANTISFGEGNTLTIGDLKPDTKVQLTYKNSAGKAVNSTVYLGEQILYNNTSADATAVSLTGGENFTAGDKVKTVTALGSDELSIAGNALDNTLTANDAGNTLDGGAGKDVLIGGNGADIFIHDKITGTTTINNYTLADDSIALGDELSIVGSNYSPASKNGTLTLTVEGANDAGKSSTSKIIIKSNDFTKAKGTTYGTIDLDGEQTSFGKDAVYDGKNVKLLSTFSGKFTASAGGEVDGSDVTKNLKLQGTNGDETLTGGMYKSTLTGGKGDDLLIGGAGKDVFTYAKGDGKDVIADFTYNADKLKVSTNKLISDISVDRGDLTFDMTDGGSVTIEDVASDDFFIKTNGTLYWFADGELVTANDKATKDKLSAIIKAPTDYAIVELDYGTNLVTAKLATASNQSATFSADDFKKT